MGRAQLGGNCSLGVHGVFRRYPGLSRNLHLVLVKLRYQIPEVSSEGKPNNSIVFACNRYHINIEAQ